SPRGASSFFRRLQVIGRASICCSWRSLCSVTVASASWSHFHVHPSLVCCCYYARIVCSRATAALGRPSLFRPGPPTAALDNYAAAPTTDALTLHLEEEAPAQPAVTQPRHCV